MKFLIKLNYSELKNPNELLEFLKTHKVVVLQNYDSDEPITPYIEKYIDNIGKIVDEDEDLYTGNLTGKKLIEITFDPSEQNLYRTAKAYQPLHTDYSYIEVPDNIQFLICEKCAPKGGATTFIDGNELVDLIKFDGEFELLDRLQNIKVGHKKGDREKLMQILKFENGVWKFNWNYPPAQRFPNTDEAKKLIDDFRNYLDKRIEKSGLLTDVLLKDNDVVFFNDSLILHGRNSYFAKNKSDRKLIKGTLVI
jgi:hypothetical protein